VSLQDYEDFARAFSGIAKANATWVWTPAGRGVFVTVALPGGVSPPTTDTTLGNLTKALLQFGNPLVQVTVKVGTVTFFEIAGDIFLQSNRIPERVKANVDDVLRHQFQFDVRQLGQNVSFSEIVALIQNVPGVNSVALTKFKLSKDGSNSARNSILVAARPQAGAAVDSVKPAEVLVLDVNCLPRSS
jgi:hypothetical protein